MAVNASFLKNLGKSVAYSSVNVMGSLAPNTMELARSARSGVDSARNFMRDNTSKLKTSGIQLDRTSLMRKTRAYLADAMADVKKGNFSLGEIADKNDDELEAIMRDIDGMASESTGSGSETPSEGAVSTRPASAGVDLSGLKATTATLKGMQELQNSIGSAIVNTTQYQTDKLTNTLFAQMASQTHHFQVMERQLDTINKNLVQMLEFQRDSQAVTNQAQLHFFDSVTRSLAAQEKRAKEMGSKNVRKKRSPMEGFMSGGWFDTSSYKDIVKDNINSSELGIIMSQMGLMSPDMIKMMLGSKGGGKIQPQRFVFEALLRTLIPKSARQSISRSDSQVNVMLKTMLGRLGSYKYQMDTHPLLGILGSIFGIDTRANRTLRLGNYKHGEMSWNGEANRVLVNVIPKELAEIKAAILKTNDVKYYDAQTGTYMSKDDVRERTKLRYQQSVETPFANIFNRVSTNPNDIANRKLWAGMSDDAKKAIEDIINKGVTNNSGMTDELSQELDRMLNEQIQQIGGTLVDTRRMAATLTNAVNTARDQTIAYIKELQESDSAFSQIATDLADKYGKVSFEKLQNFMGAENIDLIEANAGRYTQSGRRRSSMTEDERARYDSSMGFIQSIGKRMKDLQSSPDPRMRTVGKVLGKATDRFIYGSRSKYARGVTRLIDEGFGEIYDIAMLGGRRQQNTGDRRSPEPEPRPGDEGGGSGGPDSGSSGGAGARIIGQVRRAASSARSRLDARRIRLRGTTDSGEAGEGTPTNEGGLQAGNEAFRQSLQGSTPERRTADATEETRDTIDEAMGKRGFLRKFFDSPWIKKLLDKAKNSSLGKAAGEKLKQGKDYLKKLFTEDYTDEEGNVHTSVGTNIKSLLGSYKDFLFKQLGFDPETGRRSTDNTGTTPVDAAENVTDAINSVTEDVAGEDATDPNKRKAKTQAILKSLNDIVRKKAPKVLTGGVIGAALSLASGGSMGILGSMFLPGGPVGGAIAGMGLSILSQTEAFQSLMFGKKNEQGEREGGLISKKLIEDFKKALPTIGKGAAAGGAIALVGKFLGAKAGIAGVIPSMMLPGGILGAAIMGSAAALALRNDKVQDILFGKADADGKRTGSLLSGMYNKFTGKIQSTMKDGSKRSFSPSDKLKNAIKGLGIGALTSMSIGNMGLLGSLFSLGGPVGGAIAGAAIGIASASDRFNNYLFGSKDEEGKRKKDGLLSRFQAAVDLKLLEPAKNWFKSTAVDFAWWAREKIEVPFRLAFGPILDSFADLRDSMKDTATGILHKIGEKVGGGVMKILKGVGGTFMKVVLGPMGKLAGGLLKGGLFTAGSLVSAPLQILSLLMSGKRRKGQKQFGEFLRGNQDDNLQARWARQEAEGETSHKLLDRFMYRAATLPGVGNFFRKNDMMAEMADLYGESPEGEGRNNLDWLGAYADRRKYKGERKAARKESKQERKILKLRQEFGSQDKFNRDVVIDAAEFQRRQKMAKKLGIDIANEADLKKFTYDYDAWKNPGEAATPEEAADNVVTDTLPQMRDLLAQQVQTSQSILDATRANVDMNSGNVFDSSDLSNGESISEHMDEELAHKVTQNKAKANANAVVNALSNAEERKRRQAEHDRITGNTSGNATDEEEKDTETIIRESQAEGESKKTSLLDKLGGGLSGILGMILKIPGIIPMAIAGIAGALLSNENVRAFLGNALKNAIPAIADVGAKTLGLNGGVNNQRALEVDEEGNATKSVINTQFMQRLTSAAVHPGSTLKAANNVLRAVVPGVAAVENVTAKVAGGVKKVGSKLWGAAKSAAAAAGEKAASGGDLSMVQKALNFIKSGLEKAATSKLGKGFKGLTKLLKSVGSFFNEIYQKLIGKSLAKWSTKIAAALAAAGVTNVAWVTPAAILNAIYTAGSAVLGAIYPERLFKVNKDQVDWKMRLISGVFEGLMAATGMGALIGVISEIISEFTGFDFIQTLATLLYKAMSDEGDDTKIDKAISDMKQEVANYNEANGTNLSVDAYNDLKNKGFFGGIWNGIKNIVGAGDKTDYSQYEVGNYKSPSTTSTGFSGDRGGGFGGSRSGGGSFGGSFGGSRGAGRDTATGYGPGETQNDRRWGSKVIGRFPSGKTATMALAGCGPTALANAAGTLGVRTKPDDVADFAASKGYITDGGANDGLFDYGAKEMGLNTSRVNTTDGIVNNLRRGKPVIMAGRGDGPYTKAGHIVTATGIDRNGNVTVQDPRSKSPKRYRLGDLSSKMTAGWAVDKGGATGYGLFDDLLGGAFDQITGAIWDKLGIQRNTDDASGGLTGGALGETSAGPTLTPTESAQAIWNYLTKNGYTPEAAAGIMGCWQQESSNRADRVEGDFLKSFPGFQKVLSSNEALDDYTTRILFPAYKKQKINKEAYKGADGHYYPGIGLAQWTGPRGYNLFKFAKDNGKDWRDLDTQLAFFAKEIEERGLKTKWNSAANAAEAAHLVLDGYEMYSGFGAKRPDYLNPRQSAANSIYSLYNSQSDPRYKSMDKTTADKTVKAETKKKARGYGLFDDILGGAFSQITGAIYDKLGIQKDAGATDSDNSSAGAGVEPNSDGTLPTYANDGAVSIDQKKLVDMMASKYGKLNYSLGSVQDPDRGTASCASTVGWAYKKALGVSGLSASSTTQSTQYPDKFKTIWTNPGGQLPLNILKPGDILYQNWDRTSNNGKMHHTEMYAGGGKDLSHGGPGLGPVYKDLNDYRRKHTMMVRRYKPFDSVGYGEGDPGFGGEMAQQAFLLSNSGQHRSDGRLPIAGFGPGSVSSTTIGSNNRGVETRLDSIIDILRTIASSAGKPQQAPRVNVNYGDGDKKTAIQPVVVTQKDRSIGKEDAENAPLKQMHMKLASVSRFEY